MDLKQWCEGFDTEALRALETAGLLSQPDSRAYGAHMEKVIRENWTSLVGSLGCNSGTVPGRRTIYDLCCTRGRQFIGLDVKTKDLADGRYSDGGVCSVGNLLRFYNSSPQNRFVISEIGYDESGATASFAYVLTLPLHVMPITAVRIENLGTGQVRLNQSLRDAARSADWSRTCPDFVEDFCELAIAHFGRVSDVALRRAAQVGNYVDSGYQQLTLR